MRKLEQDLAIALRDSRLAQNRAGRDLHDKVIPQLTAAAMLLQLLAMDHAAAEEPVREALRTMDQAMEEVRRLSGELAPSPVYRLGLEGAIRKLAEDRKASFGGPIHVSYTRSTRTDYDLDVVNYDLVDAMLTAALARREATKIRLSVTENTVRVEVNGKGVAKPVAGISQVLASAAGFSFHLASRRGTIVLTAKRPRLKSLL
jgi:two-component system NarL family sensor kinase